MSLAIPKSPANTAPILQLQPLVGLQVLHRYILQELYVVS